MKNKVLQNNTNKQNLPLYLFHQGTNYNSYDYMGAHLCSLNGEDGAIFRVWAQNAHTVSVVGDFNNWQVGANQMKRVSEKGVYELFIAGVKEFDNYKYHITNGKKSFFKADPYAFHTETPPRTASKVYNVEGYAWGDELFLKNKRASYDKPVNIYELNIASWKRHSDGSFYTYLDLKKELVKYVVDMGYTHVEFMPIAEYPYDASWGYQITGYYAISSRFGTPKDFMELVDELHKHNIQVIVDWVPAHFPKDDFGLCEFDGTPSYENPNPTRKEHKTWGTRIFDWGRNEVQCFLVSNAIFMFEKFHVDGLRVDAVASMLYLDYDKNAGEWEPNEQGGNYNLQAIAFLQKLNKAVFERFPYAMMIAEESTAFPLVSKPVHDGGLGFNYKWNMGWMNDVLSYFACDPYFRADNHNKITFSMFYAFSENFVLPISHDEVVHGKKSLLDKMHGDINEKFSSLRAFMLYMMAHPGKKLSFMGNEYGQFKEWDYKEGLEFFMLKFDLHKRLKQFNKTLNNVYKTNPPLFEIEDSWEGFNWISVDERHNNIIAFERKDKKGGRIIALFNFSGNDYPEYCLGTEKGKYKVLISSDEKRFGGQGSLGKKRYSTAKKYAHGKENSIKLHLPKFSGVYLVEDNKNY